MYWTRAANFFLPTFVASLSTPSTNVGTRFLTPQVLGDHIAKLSLPVSKLDGFYASLARGPRTDGSVFMADPFGKLRKDFPDEQGFQPWTCSTEGDVIR